MTDIIKISALDTGTPEADAQIPYSSNEPKTYRATPLSVLSAGLSGVNVPVEPADDLGAYGLIAQMTVDTNAQGVGAPLFMAADGHLDTADADASTTSPCVALALETGTGSKKVLLLGALRNDAWNWTTGPGAASLIYASTSTGELTQTKPTGADDVIQPIGWAMTDDMIWFCPSMTYITHTG